MSYRAEIAKMLRNMPPDWRKQYRNAQRRFFEVGGPDLPDDPTPEEATLVLNLTAGGNLSADATYGPNKVPKAVRDEAMKGVRLSFKHNYGAWDFIGVARGIQLAIAPGVPDETMRRMRNYFMRHRKDKQGKNYYNRKKPSRGRMAWLNWGGDAGFKWVNKKSNPKTIPMGRCYPWAYQYLQKHPDAVLVHGTVSEPFGSPKRIDHAWIIHDGLVKDWQTMEAHMGGIYMGKGYPWPVYKELWSARPEAEYTSETIGDALHQCVIDEGRMHYGPWHKNRKLPKRY